MQNYILSPYDTGHRLEPRPFVFGRFQPAKADDYGKVDFTDDANREVATIYFERTDDGYTLHIDAPLDDIKVEFS